MDHPSFHLVRGGQREAAEGISHLRYSPFPGRFSGHTERGGAYKQPGKALTGAADERNLRVNGGAHRAAAVRPTAATDVIARGPELFALQLAARQEAAVTLHLQNKSLVKQTKQKNLTGCDVYEQEE